MYCQKFIASILTGIAIGAFALCPSRAQAQAYARAVDSLTRSYLGQLPRNEQAHFRKILKKRHSNRWLRRVDKATFDYVFIEETYCKHGGGLKTIERYFVQTDTIPVRVVENGKDVDPKSIYNGFFIWYSKNVTWLTTLNPLLAHYSTLQPTQERPYEKRQIWAHGCVTFEGDAQKFQKQRELQLKNTYQIQTMLDRARHRIVVSVQVAPEKPEFEVHGYNDVWDW